MDSLWDNPDPENRVDGIFKFSDSPAPITAPSLECECLSTTPLTPPAAGAVPAGATPPYITKCEADEDWTTWLDKVKNPALDVTSADRAFAAILVPRRPEDPDLDDASNRHTRVLEYLPFKRAIFDAIKGKMLLHYRAMAVLLHRGVPVISRIPAKFQNIDCQVYILRIQHAIKDNHQELVVTHVPDLAPPSATPRGRKTYAMVLGTSEFDRREYSRILKYFDQDAISSPFTIIKIFLELERDRRWIQIDEKITNFQRKFFNMIDVEDNYYSSNKNEKTRSAMGTMGSDPQGLVQLYMDISYLKNNLVSWMAQLEGFLDTITEDHPGNKTADFKYMQAFLAMLVCEYQSKINKCETILQGASLRFQMETVNLSRKDTNIALRDGKQMKAVAVLTMIFLPATFIATLLAVPQLESIKLEGPGGTAPWVWYLVLFLPLTVVVLGIYWVWIQFHRLEGLEDLGSNV